MLSESNQVILFASICNVRRVMRNLRCKSKDINMTKEIKEIQVEDIEVGPYEQRVSYEDEDIGALAASIRRVGLIYPIVVSETDGKFKLIEGHRRLLAHKMIGREVINCIICEKDEAENTEISFAGNFFRKELTQIELAAAIADAHEKGGLGIDDLAAGFHKSSHWIREMIAVTQWPSDVQIAVHNRVLSLSAAANLSVITDDAYRAFLLVNAVQGGVTARTTASWLQAWRALMPVEEAVNAEPVPGQTIQIPAVPQAPCFCCAQQFAVDQVSHVPICGACIQILRKVGGV